ncbi:TaqI-like C-terminal specificity domain-containing protein, partial [Ornithobacterium rhinotracheale]
VYNHLLKYKDRLCKRNKAETGIRYEWYALQRWGANYMEDFYKQKIMYSEIVREPQFYLDETGKFYPEATTFIMTGSNIEYLYHLLNSNVVTYFFKEFYAGGGLGNEGYRYKKVFLEKLPIPKNTLNIEVSEINIDNYLYNLYGFTDEEIKFLNEQFK